MPFNQEIARQVVETVFGGCVGRRTLIVLAEVWEGDEDGTWAVTVESGYLLTDLHRESELGRTFTDFDVAIEYAKLVSTEWRVKRGWWNKGSRTAAANS